MDERLLLILPEPDERQVLLISSQGRTQAFRVNDGVAIQAFIDGMADYAAISPVGGFDEVAAELGKLHTPFEMPADEKFGFLVRSFFRFAEIRE